MNLNQILKKENIKSEKIINKSKGRDHKIYLIYSKEKNLVIRIPNKDNNKIFLQAFAFEKYGKKGVAVPKVYKINKNYLIEELIEGKDMDEVKLSKNDKRKIMKDLGKQTKKMHSIKMKGFGKINKNGEGRSNSWENVMLKKIDSILRGLKKYKMLEKEEITKIKKYLYENKKFLACKTPTILHKDISGDNLIIKNKKFKSIIDAADAISGDPYLDLGIINYNFFNEELMNEFIKGYGKVDKEKLFYYTIYANTWKLFTRKKGAFKKRVKKLKYFLKNIK